MAAWRVRPSRRDEADAVALVLEAREGPPAAVLALVFRRGLGSDSADPAPTPLGEPHRTVRAGDDELRGGVGHREGKFDKVALGGDPTDLVPEHLGEPERAVRTRGDASRRASGGRDRELAEVARGG